MASRLQIPNPRFSIKPLAAKEQARICARMMTRTEPWLTLGRDYETSLSNISDPEKEVHLAWLGDELIGFIILNLKGAFVGYVQSMVIAPDRRGQGWGSKLLNFGEKRIFRDFPNVFICVSSFNPRAKALYLKLGFEEIGELKDWIISGHSEFLLRKTKGPLSGFNKDKG